MCWPCVEDRSVKIAEGVVQNMLRDADVAVTTKMIECKCALGIIGKKQVTTDIPCHSHLKGSKTGDGRDIDQGTRGLGGVPGNPTSTVGEENITMDSWDTYPAESILVHEFGHTVMNCGFSEEQTAKIKALYSDAIRQGFNSKLYMFSNPEEFWANGTQAWFNAIARKDVNAKINTRELLLQHLPGLGALMKEVYGGGTWTYHSTCPYPDKWKGYLKRVGPPIDASPGRSTLCVIL